MNRIIVTGGAGFIGANLVNRLLESGDNQILVIDKMTYASNQVLMDEISNHPQFKLVKLDLCCFQSLVELVCSFQPTLIYHLAAESHVDNSINEPKGFVYSNVVGTFNLLEAARGYYESLDVKEKEVFRFVHVSTDEVFGQLEQESSPFDEKSTYNPSSPYSASKAGADHLASAWFKTYKFPVLISNCSNNYGPYQHVEKFIPKIITKALSRETIPIFGSGEQIRDWLFVEDHVDALVKIAQFGAIGEKYVIGGGNQVQNNEIALKVCEILEEEVSTLVGNSFNYAKLIKHIEDRPGHDFRYSVDFSKISNTLSWRPKTKLDIGLRMTVKWIISSKTDDELEKAIGVFVQQ